MGGVIAGALTCLIWCLFALRFGARLGYLDDPRQDRAGLKVHRRPVVVLGGVGVFLGFHVGSVVQGTFEPLLAGATAVLLVLGLVDDRRGVNPPLRLAVESVAAVLVALGPGQAPGFVNVVLRATLVIVAINAVNLLDGIDGLAGTMAIIAAVGIIGFRGSGEGANGMVLVAGLLVFLGFNWHPAKLFLGDHGAYVTAALLCHLGFVGNAESGAAGVLVTGALLGVFWVDLATSLVRRRIAGTPLLIGDRMHIYDQLRTRGRSVRGTVANLAVAQVALVVLVGAAWRLVAEPWSVLALVGIALGSMVVVALGGFLKAAAPAV